MSGAIRQAAWQKQGEEKLGERKRESASEAKARRDQKE
jgi:hypothetical protein